jgi:hypothetical protein
MSLSQQLDIKVQCNKGTMQQHLSDMKNITDFSPDLYDSAGVDIYGEYHVVVDDTTFTMTYNRGRRALTIIGRDFELYSLEAAIDHKNPRVAKLVIFNLDVLYKYEEGR